MKGKAMTEPSNCLNDIDKEQLYGEFLRARREDRKLLMKVAHKAMDIDEDMKVEANQTHNHYHPPVSSGMGTLGKLAVGAALATGIGGLGLGALSLLRPAEQVEKIIPGVDTETIITPGEIIVE